MRQTVMRQVKLILAVFVGYLAQVSIMPYLQVDGMTPNLLIATLAIVIVGFGWLRGVWAGMFYGIVTETMLPTVSMLNLLYYPVTALLCSLFFADKSASRLQVERSTGKSGRNRSPLMRTVLCALVNAAIHEVVNLIYMYLSGSVWTAALLGRAFTSVMLTTLLTAVIMYPVRLWLGFRRQEAEKPAELRFDRRPERDRA